MGLVGDVLFYLVKDYFKQSALAIARFFTAFENDTVDMCRRSHNFFCFVCLYVPSLPLLQAGLPSR
jgi:hypothetical protein